MKPIIPWSIWALLIILAMFFVSRDARADTYSASDAQGNTIVLTDERCPDVGWIKLLLARFRYHGKDLKACWMVAGDTVFIFDDAGDITPLPKQIFTKDMKV